MAGTSVWWRAIAWTLVAVGVGCLAEYGWRTHQLQRAEARNRAAVERMLAEEPPSTLSAPLPALSPKPFALSDPTLLGALDIPRLRLSAAVRIGDDEETLDGAVGYLPDTAPPWEKGNTALAAHRDRLFRALEGIRADDEILVSTRHGTFEYRVNRTFVVRPKDVWILEPVPNVDLTLITCYPFAFTGHAPYRFVVRAQKVGQEGDDGRDGRDGQDGSAKAQR